MEKKDLLINKLRFLIVSIVCIPLLVSCDEKDDPNTFNNKGETFPQTIMVSIDSITLPRNGESELIFSVYPKNALFNYNVGSDSCQVSFDLLTDSIEEFSLTILR